MKKSKANNYNSIVECNGILYELMKSSDNNTLEAQLSYGIKKTHAEFASLLKEGDLVKVNDMKCLGESTKDVIMLLNEWVNKKIQFNIKNVSGFDTSDINQNSINNTIVTLADFINEKDKNNTSKNNSCRSRGRGGGRKFGLSEKAIFVAKQVEILYCAGTSSIKEIMEYHNISRATIYRYLKYQNVDIKGWNRTSINSNNLTDKSGLYLPTIRKILAVSKSISDQKVDKEQDKIQNLISDLEILLIEIISAYRKLK